MFNVQINSTYFLRRMKNRGIEIEGGGTRKGRERAEEGE
jgi:hypothetical protein